MNTNVLETYRLEQGMTYRDLAKTAGIASHGVVYEHCKGQRNMSAETAKKYHDATGIPLSELRPDLWRSDDDGSESEGED